MSDNTAAATTDDVESATPTVTTVGATTDAKAAIPAVSTGSGEGELQPLLAGWLKDRQAFLDTVGRALCCAAHRTSWHGLRLPLYALRLVVLAPRGAGRVLRALFLFLSDAEGRPLRVDAVAGSDPATWLRLRKERNERVHRRLIVAGTLLGLVVLGAAIVVGLAAADVIALPPAWVGWLLAFAVVQVLGYVGRPVGSPWSSRPPCWSATTGRCGPRT